MTNLVPVGELKPISFFRLNNLRMLKLANLGGRTWVAFKSVHGDSFCRTSLNTSDLVAPIPDCDSFDWQPPREPTALELAKELIDSLSKQKKFCEANHITWTVGEQMQLDSVRKIIAAMEREAKQ